MTQKVLRRLGTQAENSAYGDKPCDDDRRWDAFVCYNNDRLIEDVGETDFILFAGRREARSSSTSAALLRILSGSRDRPALVKRGPSGLGQFDQRSFTLAPPAPDQALFGCVFPDRQPRAARAPSVHYVGIGLRAFCQPLQKIEDQGVRRFTHVLLGITS